MTPPASRVAAPSGNRRIPRRSGYTAVRGSALVEVVIAILIVAVIAMFFSLLSATASRSFRRAMNVSRAAYLAAGLLDEIRARRWDEKTTGASLPLGVDPGESASDKTTFDDVDDFNGYIEPALKDAAGAAVSGFAGFTRQAAVAYIDANNAVAPDTTPRKRVIVTVLKDGRQAAQAQSMISEP